MDKIADPILTRFRAELDRAYGERIERFVLFGSRARGDARADSDHDVAVFLNGYRGLWNESEPITEIETKILYDTGAVINSLPFRAGAYADRTGFMGEVRREGVDL